MSTNQTDSKESAMIDGAEGKLLAVLILRQRRHGRFPDAATEYRFVAVEQVVLPNACSRTLGKKRRESFVFVQIVFSLAAIVDLAAVAFQAGGRNARQNLAGGVHDKNRTGVGLVIVEQFSQGQAKRFLDGKR